jgi:hypothetical protein
MAVVLDRVQRDVLYRFVVGDLPDVSDIARELNYGHATEARRLRRRLDEDMRLLDLLGWGERGGPESYEIALPAEEAKAIFSRLRARIMSDIHEAMSTLLGNPVSEALAAAGICASVVPSTEGETRTACHLHAVPRRPECG